MNAVRDFFSSLKEDLFGKRLLPFLIVLAIVLVAAVGYAVLGGGSSAAPGSVTASAPAGASAAIGEVTVSQAPANPNQSISETTEGTSKQHHGIAHDPFTPLPEEKKAPASSTTASSSSPSSTPSAGSTPSPRAPAARRPRRRRKRLPAKPEGLRPLPRDRTARRRAGGRGRRAGAASPAEDLSKHGARRTAARQGQPAARVPRGRAAHRQGSAVRAQRRGDPARKRHLPAKRDPVPGDRPAGRPERDARSRRS